MIRTSIKTQLIIHQLKYVVEKTVKDKRLDDVIEYGVSERIITNIWIMGTASGQIHAKMDISVSYDSDGTTFDISGNVNDRIFTGQGNDWLHGEADNNKANCPVWSEAINWFVKLCHQEKLSFKWGIIVSDMEQELIDKFRLVSLTDEDKTRETQTFGSIPNSVVTELNMGISFSPEKFGD